MKNWLDREAQREQRLMFPTLPERQLQVELLRGLSPEGGGPLSFNIFSNDLQEKTEDTHSKSAGNTRLEGAGDTLHSMSNRNLAQGQQGEDKVLHLLCTNQGHANQRADQLGSSSAGKDTGVVADSKPCEAVGPGLVQPRGPSQPE